MCYACTRQKVAGIVCVSQHFPHWKWWIELTVQVFPYFVLACLFVCLIWLIAADAERERKKGNERVLYKYILHCTYVYSIWIYVDELVVTKYKLHSIVTKYITPTQANRQAGRQTRKLFELTNKLTNILLSVVTTAIHQAMKS